MRPEIVAAIREFSAKAFSPGWAGSKIRQYWEWFNAADDAIVAMAADEEEAAEIRDALLDIRADAPYQGPDEMLDDVI